MAKEKEKVEAVKEVKEVEEIDQRIKEKFSNVLSELTGTRAAVLFDKNMEVIGKIPVKEMFSTMKSVENIYAIVFDGSVDQKLLNFASERGVSYIVGMTLNGRVRSRGVKFLTKKDFS